MSQQDPQLMLRDACISGDVEHARKALELGAKANPKGVEWNPNFPLLGEAARHGHAQLCELLMAHGATLSTEEAWNILLRSKSETVDLKPIIKGIDYAKSKAPEGLPWGIFFAKLCINHPKLVDLIHEHYPCPSTLWNTLANSSIDNEPVSPLSVLVGAERDVVIKKIWPHIQIVDPKSVAKAAANGSALLPLLLQKGGNPNARENGNAALHFASFGNHIETVRQLLAAGARIDTLDSHGNTPMMRATELPMMQALAQLGASFKVRDKKGTPALHHMVENLLERSANYAQVERTDRLRQLLELAKGHAVDLTCRSASGETIMHVLARKRHEKPDIELIQSLSGCPSLINEGDVMGITPLMIKLDRGEDINRYLECGANIDSVDVFGQSPLMKAVMRENTMSAITLITHGARIDLIDDNGYNALDHAIAINDCDMITILRAVDSKPAFHSRWEGVPLSSKSESRLKQGPLTALMTIQDARLMSHYLNTLQGDAKTAFEPADLKRAMAIDNKSASECGAILKSRMARDAISKIASLGKPLPHGSA